MKFKLKQILIKIKRQLYRKYLAYEKYLVWQVSTFLFCACTMQLSKQIFNIYLPFTSWSIFLETVGLAGVLISAIGVWIAWNGETRSVAARKEEQKIVALEKCEEKQLRQETTILSLKEAIAFNKNSLDEARTDIARLTAQVGQMEVEAIMKRKIAHLEERFSELQKMVEK